jgi:hypothetical protein
MRDNDRARFNRVIEIQRFLIEIDDGANGTVINRVAQHSDPGVGMLGVGVTAGLAQIRGRRGLQVKDQAHR